MPRNGRRTAAEWRHRFYEILEEGPVSDRANRIVDSLLIGLIVVNLVALTLESMPALVSRYGALFAAVELFSLVVFSLEYVLRIWVAVDHAPVRHLSPLRARLAFVTSAAGIVDLLAVAPFWLAFFVPLDLRFVLVLRVVRFLKLARYSPGMRSLIEALYAERRALFGCFVMFAGAVIFAAAAMHLAESHVQPDKLGTILDAMWWAFVTLGTVGYGDVVPVTAAGKIVAAFAIVASVFVIALPVGVVATAFADQIHRRDFIVTWGMVARVPLFSGLTAGEIADVMRLLRAETIEPGAIVTRRGDPAHSMYFIARGEVEIELAEATRRLGMGHFFGEVAALRQARRSATVRARERTSLLVLDAKDLRALMDRQPQIAARLRETVHARIGRELITPQGDIVTEELNFETAKAAKARVKGPRRRATRTRRQG
ncbi:MAG: ion transporter [Rhizobiales bacterium]|nr:ion transporter [Hyphomicrobiales bacterium]